MGTKIAEIYTEVSMDLSRAMSSMGTMKGATQKFASDIQGQLDAVKRAADFEIRLGNVTSVGEATKVFDTIVDKIAAGKRELASFAAMKQKVLMSEGFSVSTARAFSTNQGLPPTVGGSVSGQGAANVAAIDAQRIQTLQRMQELLGLRAAAEGKLTVEAVKNTQAILAQCRAEDTGRAARLGAISAQEKLAAIQPFATSVINQFTTAAQRQEKYIIDLNAAYHAGLVPIGAYTAAMKFAANQTNFSGGSGMGKGSGGLGMLAMQASYGLQDFITVMGMGGGLRAAMGGMSNNLSQMVMILGMMGTISTPLAAALSIATALGAALVPMLFDTGKAGKTAAESLVDLERALKRVKQATDDLSASRKAKDVSDIETFGQSSKEIRQAAKERDEFDKQIKDELESQVKREAMQTPVVASRQIPERLRNLKPGAEGQLELLGLIDDALGGKGEFGKAADIRDKMNRTGKPVDVGGGRQISREGDNFVVRQLPTGDELKKFQEGRQESQDKVSQLGKDRQDKEDRITEAKKKQAQLGNEEVSRMRDQNDDTDSLDKKLTKINEEEKKRVKEAEHFASTGDARGPQMILEAQQWGERARHEARNDDEEKGWKKLDDGNQAFIKKKEQREKEAAHLAHQMEGETLGDRAKKFQGIRAQLEERRDWIDKNVKDPDERNRLLKLAVDSASHQEALVRPKGGDKTTATGLADAIQKGLFEGDATKYMKDTAKNTADQLGKLDDVIKAIKESAGLG